MLGSWLLAKSMILYGIIFTKESVESPAGFKTASTGPLCTTSRWFQDIFLSLYWFSCRFRPIQDRFLHPPDCVNKSQLTTYLDLLNHHLCIYFHMYRRHFSQLNRLPSCHEGGRPHGYSDLADQERGCGVGSMDTVPCTSSFHPK